MTTPLILTLLNQKDWGAYQPLVDELHHWEGYPLFEQRMLELKRDALFKSKVHGLGHIERTMTHGALCAMKEPLDQEDTGLLLYACAYHDTARINDWVDDLHGHRATQKLPVLTNLTGEALHIVQAAVDAHSRSDAVLSKTVESYQLEHFDRGLRIAELLKDSDGLDRVRIWDLNPRYLRRKASRERAGFAQELYSRYQAASGGVLVPDFVREWKGLDEWGNPKKS